MVGFSFFHWMSRDGAGFFLVCSISHKAQTGRVPPFRLSLSPPQSSSALAFSHAPTFPIWMPNSCYKPGEVVGGGGCVFLWRDRARLPTKNVKNSKTPENIKLPVNFVTPFSPLPAM